MHLIITYITQKTPYPKLTAYVQDFTMFSYTKAKLLHLNPFCMQQARYIYLASKIYTYTPHHP